MSKKLKQAVPTTARRCHVERRRGSRNFNGARRYQNLFVEGGKYVFDGNRVVAHWRVGSNGVGRWLLYTINTDLSLVITPNLRIRKYRRNVVPIIRSFETVLDALKPLDEAKSYCAQHCHRWSPAQGDSSDPAPYIWRWCLTCGVEQVWFYETGELLQWPDDAATITTQTAGALPTLHGSIVGGAR
jgi:hypothetical protein